MRSSGDVARETLTPIRCYIMSTLVSPSQTALSTQLQAAEKGVLRQEGTRSVGD